MSEQVLDYAIVGGGISGLYGAWRLQEADSTLSIKLFESSDRVGGRLLTVTPPNMPDSRVELGGMRYIVEEHPWVVALVKHLNLATEPLPADEPTNIAYLRGKLLRMFELTDPTKIPYNVAPNEQDPGILANLTGQAAALSLAPTIKKLFGIKVTSWKDLKLTPAQWQTVAMKGTYNEAPLWSLPMRYLMMRSITREALALDEDSGGYDSILYTWNAADGFGWNLADFTAVTTYVRIKKGYDQVPLMLADRFQKAGGAVHPNARLERFDATSGLVTLDIVEGGRTKTIQAKRLILALPRRSLELLDQTGSVLGPEHTDVHELIRSVTPIPLFKLAILYPDAWWETFPPVQPTKGPPAGLTQGRSVTDLPIRQCYYWDVDATTNYAVLLVYDDGRDLSYWAGLRDAQAQRFEPAVEVDDASAWAKYPAPKRMVEEIHRQLLVMHGNPGGIPQPVAGAYRDWGEDPYGGGANFWHVGVKSYAVAESIMRPKPSLPVYICGESYSHGQGWVEGALETTEEMLEKHFGLAKPPWKQAAEQSAEQAKAAPVTS
jgi:monoamine oxidase